MKVVARKERGNWAVEWVRAGHRQTDDMGGQELLSCCFFVANQETSLGVLPTQVRANEDPRVLDILLDRLLDRFEDFVPHLGNQEQENRFCEKILWFGPEMAEEY